MSKFRANLGKTLIDLVWCFGVTALFFAPFRFYYTGYFGIFAWLVFSEGDPPVQFFPGRLAFSVVLWAACLFLISRWLRYLDSKAYVA